MHCSVYLFNDALNTLKMDLFGVGNIYYEKENNMHYTIYLTIH